MKKILSTLLFILIATLSYAQTSKVTLTVIDAATQEGVAGAVISVAPADDPTNEAKTKHYTSGYAGSTSITGLKRGDYKMTIAFLGYAHKEVDLKANAANIDLGKIALEEEATKIETVVKTVQAIRASQKGDTIAYNTDAYKVAADADVEGLLKKMPGIEVSEGSVTVQGETVQKVFIDGKEFFGDDVATAINTLPAQSIKAVEVVNKLSDQAEFSGRDDGDSYKALNLVTHQNMRQGVFGKVYAGYGYQPKTDRITDHHKYVAGGNVNIFNGDSRITITGLLNNINKQNFSFEDILGVAGGGMGGRGGGVGGGFMMGRQRGIANVASLGLNYSNNWKNNKFKLQASYFFNRTRSRNLNEQITWYEAPLENMGTKEQEAFSDNKNHNHRFNARFDWRIAENQSLMARTNFSFQGYTPFSETDGYQDGEDFYNIIMSGSEGKNSGYNLSQFLQYNLRLNDNGRMLSFDANFRYRDNDSNSRSFSNERTIQNSEGGYDPYLRYLENMSGSNNMNVSASVEYTEPLSKSSQLQFEYEFGMNSQESNRNTYNFGNDASYTNGVLDAQLSNIYKNDYITHEVGPSFNWSKNRNNIVVRLNYQHSTLDGQIKSSREQAVKRSYNDFTYFVRGMFYFNQQHSINVMARANTNNPGIQQLNSILDISDMQYMSTGNEYLDPAYSHMFMLNYNFTNLEKGRTLMLMGMFNTSNNYIGQSLYTGPNAVQKLQELYGTTATEGYKPTQFSTYENVGGQKMVMGMIHYGFPINFLKSNMNLMFGVNYSETPSLVNGVRNIASNMGYNGGVTLGSNISENVDFTIGWNGAYNLADNSLAGRGNKNEYFNHSASANLKAVFWKGITFTASASYVQNIGYTNDYNDSYALVNAYIGKKVFKNQLGEVLVGVNDIFNQNTSFSRSTGSGYTQNMWNSVIGRYFTVQFTYNLRMFGKKGSQNISDYESQGGRRGFGGMPGQGGRPAGGPPVGGPPAGGPPMGGGRGPGGFGGGMR